MSEAKHTPTPWRLYREPVGRRCLYVVAGSDATPFLGEVIATPTTCPDYEANAEFIVCAVNCHADLLAACEAGFRVINRLARGGELSTPEDGNVTAMLREAIAKATPPRPPAA
jgi:hypothetical protein